MILPPDEGPLDDRAFVNVVRFVAVGSLLSIGAIVLTRRFLYADSSLQMLALWGNESFAIAHVSRWFGLGVSQWMPVLAMKVGWRDPGGVASLYGLNLWLNPVLAVVAAWFASGRSREITTAVLLCVLLLFQSTYVVIDSEASVFFWLFAVLSIVTLRRDYPLWSLGLLMPIYFTHDAVVLVLAPVVAILLGRRRAYVRYYGAIRYWALVIGSAALGVLIAWRASRPGVAEDRGNFVGGTLSLFGSPALVLTALAFGALAVSALRPRVRGSQPLFWVSSVALLALPFLTPALIWPFFHYRARVLNAALALLLFLYLHGRVHWGLAAPARLPAARVVWLAGVVFLFQGKVTWEWSRHVELFRTELRSQGGVVRFPDDGPFAEPRSRQFSWSWTSPTRSIVFQALDGETVRTLMLNEDTTVWQPFDPRRPSELPDLSPWGVSYGTELTGGR